MKSIEKSRVEEIKNLHSKFVESFRKTIDYGIRIGEILSKQKSDLRHGEFGPWVERNLPFSRRTVQNYMKLYRERDRLKNATVSHLTGAYRMLAESRKLKGYDKIIHCYANSVNEVREELDVSWEDAFTSISDETGFPVKVLVNWHHHFFGQVSDSISPEPIKEDEMRQIEVVFAKIINEMATKYK